MKNWIRKYWFEIALACAGIIVVALGAGGFLFGAHLGPSEGRAQIGDFVGGTTTPILTALTFIGVLVGIALQRRELIETRKELQRSAEALENQGAHLAKRQLSQSFFDLFDMYKSVVSGISISVDENRISGKDALERYAFIFFPKSPIGPMVWDIERLQETHSRLNPNLGNYFRIIFRILNYLAEHEKDGEFYADMFRAQLSTPELYLLFFNCCSQVGSPMQEYASRFEIFDNMPIPDGEKFASVALCLDKKSFGKNKDLLALVQGTH